MAKEGKKVGGEKGPQIRRKGRAQEEAEALRADSLPHSWPRAVDLSVGPGSAAPASPGSRIRQADSRAPSQTY